MAKNPITTHTKIDPSNPVQVALGEILDATDHLDPAPFLEAIASAVMTTVFEKSHCANCAQGQIMALTNTLEAAIPEIVSAMDAQRQLAEIMATPRGSC